MTAKRSATNGSFVSRSAVSGVFQEIRRPDGKHVTSMNRDTYDRALAAAKSVLNSKR